MAVENFVALLAEGVDRNSVVNGLDLMPAVALLAEGVDRNSDDKVIDALYCRRPPRGGRG